MADSRAIKPLNLGRYPTWLALAAKHNGVWGGCYCSHSHADTGETVKREYDRPAFKER